MTRSLVYALVFSAFVVACGDDPKKLPIGSVCDGNEACESNFCAAGTCLDPASDDDGDGLINQLEVALGSNPLLADTDTDGIEDGAELDAFANVDTDGDGKPDVVESAVTDQDGDCITDQYDSDDAVPSDDVSPMIPVVCRQLGVCASGTLSVSCASGSAACVYTGVAGFTDPEVTCNGADDDCDGETDEDFPDRDKDGVADCVDIDWDNDGVADTSDVCPEIADPAQADTDADGLGDACADAYGWTFDALPSAVVVGESFSASGRLVRLAAGDGPPPPKLASATLATDPAGAITRTLTLDDNAWSLDDLAFAELGSWRLVVGHPGTASGTSDAIASVPGGFCRLVATAPATVVAGAPFDVSVSAEDAGGHRRGQRSGTVTVTVDCAGAVPAPGTAPFIDGTAHISGVVLTEARTCVVTFAVDETPTDGGCAGVTTADVVVTPTVVDHLELTRVATDVDADAAFDVTLTARDGFGNIATGYAGLVTWSSTDTRAVLPAPFQFDAAAAGVTIASMRLRTAGLQDVIVADQALLGARVGVTVLPGVAARFVVTAPEEVTAGVAFGVGVSARDAFDNVATGFGGALVFSSDDALATLPTGLSATAGVANANNVVLRMAGPVTITVTSGAVTGNTTVGVVTGQARRFVLEGAPSRVVAGAPFDVTVHVEDLFGNPDLAWEGVVEVDVDDPLADLPSPLAFGAGGIAVLEDITLGQAGTWIVTVRDPVTPSLFASFSVIVDPGALSTLAVDCLPASVRAGETSVCKFRATDDFGNLRPDADAAIDLLVSDTQASAPATVTLADGAGQVNVVLKTVGSWTVGAVLDGVAGQDSVVVTAGAIVRFALTLAAESKAGVSEPLVIEARDAFDNRTGDFAGAIALSVDDALATLAPTVTMTVGDAGRVTASVTFGTRGMHTVQATIGASASGTAQSNVRAGAPTKLVLTGAAQATSDVAAAFDVTIEDAFGNRADDPADLYLGTVSFSVVAPAPDLAPTLPGPTLFVTGDASAHAFSATWLRAGGWTLRATGTGLDEASDDLTITVAPGPAHHFALSAPTTVAAGASFAISAVLRDARDNALTAPSALVITVPSGCTGPAAATVPPASISGYACTLAGAKSFGFAAGAVTANAAVTVTATAPTSVEVVLPANAKAGVAVVATLRVRDANGNIASGYNGTFALSSGDVLATVPASAQAVGGEATADITFGSVGSQALTATVGALSDDATTTVRAGSPDHVVLSDAGGVVSAGVSRIVDVRIEDAFGNIADDAADEYLGTLTFGASPTPATAPILPSPLVFVAGDRGARSVAVTWYQTGTWNLTALASMLANANASRAFNVVPAAADHFVLTGPGASAPATSFAFFVALADAFDNTVLAATSVTFGVPAGCTGPASASVPPATVGGFSCTDAGEQTFTFTAGSISDSLDVTIDASAPATLTLTLPAAAKAGVATSASLVAYDAFGNIATGYNGNFNLSSSDAKATVPASVQATAGEATFDVTFGSVGAQSLTALLGTVSDMKSATVRAGAPHHMILSDAGGNTTAGVARDFALLVTDSYGNRADDPADTYTGTVTMSVVAPGPDLAPSLPSPITFTASDLGLRTAQATWFRTGAWTLRGTGTALATTTADLPITVVAGAADHFVVTGPPTIAAGTSFPIDIVLADASGNPRTTATSVTITVPSGCTGASSASVPPKTVTGFVCTTSGTQRFSFTAGAITADLDVPVTPLAPASVELVLPATAKAGVVVAATARARDTHGNIASGFTGAFAITSGDVNATVPATVQATAGEATFDVTFGSVGTQSLTAQLGGFSDQKDTTVRAGAPHHMLLSDAGGNTTSGVARDFTLLIVDSYGNRANDPADTYTGTVTMSVVAPGPDLAPSLPSPITFTGSDLGQRTAQATWFRAGSWTLRGTGTALTTASADLPLTVVAGAADHLVLTGPASIAAGTTFAIDVVMADASGNPRSAATSVTITRPSGCTGPASTSVPPKAVTGFSCTVAATQRFSFTAGTISADLDVPVTALDPANVELILPANSKAGVAASVTVRARDSFGNIASGFVGDFVISSGDARATVPSPVTATAGEATFDVTFGTVGTQSVTATLGGFSDQENTTVRAGAPHHLTLSDAGGTATSGVARAFTLTINDSYGNRANDAADAYTGSVTMSVVAPGPDLPPTLPSPITFSGSDLGQRTAQATWFRAGAWTLRGTGTLLAVTTADLPITVGPGAPHHFVLNAPASIAAATSFAIDVELADASDNVLTATTGLSIQLPSGCTGPTSGSVPPKAVSGFSCGEAGTQRVTFSAGAISDFVDVVVTPLGPASVEVLLPTTAKAGVAVSATVRALDSQGNVSTGFTGIFTVTSGDAQATYLTAPQASAGVATFDVTFGTVGTQSLGAQLDAFSDSKNATVRAGTPHHMVLTDAGGNTTSGVARDFTITVVDSFGNRANDPADTYTGTVTMSVVDPQPDLAPTLPSPIAFSGGDLGQRTAQATWFRAGAWTLRGTGTVLTTTTADRPINVVAAAADHFDVTGPATVAATTSFAFDIVLADASDNPVTTATDVTITVPTGCSGSTSATVPPKAVTGFACTLAGTHSFTFTAGAITTDVDVPVTPLAPASVEVLLPTTAKAGVAVSATVRALDSQGNVSTGFIGTFTVTSGDAQAIYPTAPQASAGVATFDVTFGTVGTQSLGAELDAFSDAKNALVRAGSPHHMVLTDAGGNATSGVARDFTITVVDSFGNRANDPADTYTGTVTMSVVAPGPDLTPALPSPIAFSGSDLGQRTAQATWFRAGAWTLRGTGTALTTTTADRLINVVAGAAHHFDVTGPATITTTTSFPFDIVLADASGNPRTTATTVTITVPNGCTGPTSASVPPKTVTGFACSVAGTRKFTFTAGAISVDVDVPVTPLPPAGVEVTLPANVKAGAMLQVTVRAIDAQGNTELSFNGPFTMTSSDAQATYPAAPQASGGSVTFNMNFGTAGTQSLKAELGALSDSKLSTVRAGSPHHLVLTDAGGNATAGTPKSFTLTIADSFGNRANDPADTYTGTVTMSVVAPGPNVPPTLPSPITFLGTDLGQRTAQATWFSAGAWTLRGTGTALTTTTADLAINVVAGAAHHLAWSNYGNESYVGAALRHNGQPLAIEVVDASGNRVVGASASISVKLTYNTGRAVLGGTTTRAVSSGVASFDDLVLDKPGYYVLEGTASGLTKTPNALVFGCVYGPATLTNLSVSGGPSCLDVSFDLAHDQSAPVDVVMQWSWRNPLTDETEYLPASLALTAAAGPTHLDSSPSGVGHTLTWDVTADVPRDLAPLEYDNMVLRVTANTGYFSDAQSVAVSPEVAAKMTLTNVPPPSFPNLELGPAAPIVADFDRDGHVDIGRMSRNTTTNAPVLEIVFDAGGARVPKMLDFSNETLPPRLAGHVRSTSGYDAFWYVEDDTDTLRVVQYDINGAYLLNGGDGVIPYYPCDDMDSRIYDVVAADFDLDGVDEFAVACAFGVVFVDPGGSGLQVDTPELVHDLAVADWEPDGYPDLVAASDHTLFAVVWSGGTFQIKDTLDLPGGAITDLVGFDGHGLEASEAHDGASDLMVADGTSILRWVPSDIQSDEAGIFKVFGDPIDIAALSNVDVLAAADVDGDNQDDIVGTLRAGGNASVLRRSRSATFFAEERPELSFDLATGDIDQDGRDEVVFGTAAFADVLDFSLPPLCQPDIVGPESVSSFVPGQQGNFQPLEHRFVDVDHDGKLDWLQVSTDYNDRTLSVARGLGRGKFAKFTVVAPASDDRPTIGDFDEDGLVDAAWADESDIQGKLRQPGGGYQDVTLMAGLGWDSDTAGRLFATDLDGDGHDDLLIASDHALTWYAGDGMMHFAQGVDVAHWDAFSQVPWRFEFSDQNEDGLYEPLAFIRDTSGVTYAAVWNSSSSGWDETPKTLDLGTGGDGGDFRFTDLLSSENRAVMKLSQDWEFGITNIDFARFSVDRFLPAHSVQIVDDGNCYFTDELTMAHESAFGPTQPYALFQCVDGYVLGHDLADPDNYGFEWVFGYEGFGADGLDLLDVDGDDVVDIVGYDRVWSGLDRSLPNELPTLEAGRELYPPELNGIETRMLVADFDGDGYQDLATVDLEVQYLNYDGTQLQLQIDHAKPLGDFVTSTEYLGDVPYYNTGSSSNVEVVAPAMGRVGLVVTSNSLMSIFRPDFQSGGFVYTPDNYTFQGGQEGRRVEALVNADLDGDGLDELVGAIGWDGSTDYGDVFVRHQSHAGTFESPLIGTDYLDDVGRDAVAVGHFAPPSNSTLLQIALGCSGNGAREVRFYRVDSGFLSVSLVGSFPLGADFDQGSPIGLWALDIDHDGRDDLAVGRRGDGGEGIDFTKGVRFFLQTGNGFVPAGGVDFTRDRTRVLGFADLDRDGRVELVTDDGIYWGHHAVGVVDFAPLESTGEESLELVGDWPWRGRPSLFGNWHWYSVPDGEGPPMYRP